MRSSVDEGTFFIWIAISNFLGLQRFQCGSITVQVLGERNTYSGTGGKPILRSSG